MKVAVVYSIGERCFTEMILKRLYLIKFSSIFGSMNIKNYDNLIKCFNTNFTILFENENLIFTKNNPKFAIENESHGYRTINKIFDNVNDYHDATIPHHDLSNNIDKQHFIITFFIYIYIYIYMIIKKISIFNNN